MTDTANNQLRPTGVDTVAKDWLNSQLAAIETHLDADVLTVLSPIAYGLDHRVRVAVEGLTPRRKSLLVILDTPGGVVEVVERMAVTLRFLYPEVKYLVPDRAMSAGTVWVMSGDAILMDYYSCLGPIDPQVERDGRLVPALSYLEQFNRLIKRSEEGKLTTAELVLLRELDLAELHQFELAATLSVKLIKEWLTKYKFKDWNETETRREPVTDDMKRERAEAIATQLSKHDRWATHARGIHMHTLTTELNLKIDDYSADQKLKNLVWNYFWFLRDFLLRKEVTSFVHTRVFF